MSNNFICNVSSEDVCGIPEEFTSDEARLIAAVKKAIRDEELAVASISNDVSVCSFQTCLVEESLSTEQELLTTYEEQYTPPTPCVCINDITKGARNFINNILKTTLNKLKGML
jgi:hypothetical protein